jgi:hypothetical protein
MNPNRLPDWWDPYSCQPRKLPTEAKPRTGARNLAEYLKVAATLFTIGPLVAARYAFGSRAPTTRPAARDFIGLSVTPDDEFNDAIVDMVAELGVQRLLFRVPCWEADDLDRYHAFVERLPGCEFVVNILQSRDSVDDPHTWQRQVHDIVTALRSRVEAFQIGNAFNRSKWGCRHSGEALDLTDHALKATAGFEGISIAASSVIDFEPLITLRTLFNFHPQRFDICAAQLYVNRRGSPHGRQYGVFDLERKIRLIAAMLAISNTCGRRLWISETNWPLLDTRPWTPNSGHPRSTVDEATQAAYLTDYYRIAWQTGLVERVYWWQLINPGYGLVDHRDGTLRRMPSFHAFAALLRGALHEETSSNRHNQAPSP